MTERTNPIRDVLVGKDFIPDNREFKYALLRAQFSIIIFLAVGYYLILDSIRGVTVFIPWYLLMITFSIIVILINRAKFYKTSTILLLGLLDILIFMFCDVDTPYGGVFFYFTTCSITGLILAGYYSLRLGFFFALLPILLGYIAYSYDLNLLPRPPYDPDMIRVNFVVNFVIGILSNIFVIYFLISRNRATEISLRESRQHDQKVAEEISIKNLELAKTNEELDRFVYSASHDMRAPLSSLLGLINLCEKASSAEEAMTYIELMKGRIKTMEGFIKEITDYSRNARLNLVLEEINLIEVLSETTQVLSYIEKNQKIRIAIDPGCHITIRTDKTRLKVIVNNLISNAFRYHRVNQDDPFILIRAEKNNGNVSISVKDNGSGIPEEHHQKIFDMFYRASEVSEGSGLGLYIVKETLTKLEGTITVESIPGVGSTFSFSIPA